MVAKILALALLLVVVNSKPTDLNQDVIEEVYSPMKSTVGRCGKNFYFSGEEAGSGISGEDCEDEHEEGEDELEEYKFIPEVEEDLGNEELSNEFTNEDPEIGYEKEEEEEEGYEPDQPIEDEILEEEEEYTKEPTEEDGIFPEEHEDIYDDGTSPGETYEDDDENIEAEEQMEDENVIDPFNGIPVGDVFINPPGYTSAEDEEEKLNTVIIGNEEFDADDIDPGNEPSEKEYESEQNTSNEDTDKDILTKTIDGENIPIEDKSNTPDKHIFPVKPEEDILPEENEEHILPVENEEKKPKELTEDEFNDWKNVEEIIRKTAEFGAEQEEREEVEKEKIEKGSSIKEEETPSENVSVELRNEKATEDKEETTKIEYADEQRELKAENRRTKRNAKRVKTTASH